MLKIFFTSFKSYKYKYLLIFILIGSFISAFLEMLGLSLIPIFVSFLMNGEKLDYYLDNFQLLSFLKSFSNSELVFIFSGFIVFIYLLKNMFIAFLIFFECFFFRNFKKYLARNTFFSYMNYPFDFHLKNNPSLLIRNVTSEVAALSTYLQSIVTIVREILILLFLIILLIFVDPLVMFIVIIFLASVSSLFYFFVKESLRIRGGKAQMHRGNLIKTVSEGFYAIREVKIFNKMKFFLSKFSTEINGAENNDAYQQIISSMPKLFLEVCAVSAVLLVTTFFVLLNRPFEEMLPILSLLGITIVRMVPLITSMTTQLALIKYFTASAIIVSKEIEKLHEDKKSFYEDLDEDKSNFCFEKVNRIELNNISFEYLNHEPILKEISMVISENESIGIIGSTGAGKSTLINIILGLLSPKNGSVYVNSININDQIINWRKIIGYVPQDIYLTDDTIINNIGFGLETDEIDKEKIISSLKLAKLDEFVLNLRDGLNTYIGDRGIRLSGGQKQRLGIARAIYNNPKVLIIDEGTNSLDQKTEQLLIDEIYNLNQDRIIIFVSHRLASLSSCDRLYYLEGGKILIQGDYKSVINNNKLKINKIRKYNTNE